MRVVMIGSGNVASVLGRLIKRAGHNMIQVISREPAHAKILADELGCAFSGIDGDMDLTAELYIIAVKDTAIAELKPLFQLTNKLVVHTAGSLSKDVLKDYTHNYGVIYPLQSLRKEMDASTVIPLLVDANTADMITLLEDFALTLTGNVARASDDERLKLHVAAVIVSNFTNHLYVLAEDFCKKENVLFSMLIPLIIETAQRIADHSPADVQTGPAFRNDLVTIEKHLRLLNDNKELKKIYLQLSDSIMNR